MLLIPVIIGILFYLALPELQENDTYLPVSLALSGMIILIVLIQIRFNQIAANFFKVLFCLIVPLIAAYLTEYCFGNDLFALKPNIIIMNYGCYAVVLVTFFVITGRIKGGCVGTLVTACIFAIANAFVMKFRGTPIVPWDMYSLRTAASVSGNYMYSLSGEMLITALGTILGVFIVLQLPRVKTHWGRYSIGWIIALFCLPYGYISIVRDGKLESWGVERSLWSQAGAIEVNGVCLNFINNTKDFIVDKPDDYNYEEEKAIFQKYKEPVLSKSQKEKRPTIIAIMNESFCEMASLVEEGAVELNKNPLPFTSKWEKNVICGNMLVSVYGGGTATTEFEFLTGQAQAFYPLDSVAYQQFIHEDTLSLASILKSYGYKTIALHPFYGGGWNRFNVYPLLGFEQFIDISNIKHYKQLNDYCSDASNYENIIEEYENRGDSPLFVFNVTMQNHGGYVGNKVKHTIKDKKIKDDSLDEYLSLTYESDQALKDLVAYFSKQEDPVVICFFGDHWPKLGKAVYNPLFEGVEEFDRALIQHTVPFYIWANYDIKEKNIEWTSPNFLSGLILETANLPLDPWRQYLKEVQKEIDAVSTIGYIDKSGKIYDLEEENQWISELKKAQYYYFQDREK